MENHVEDSVQTKFGDFLNGYREQQMIRREKSWAVITCDGCGLKRKDTEWRPYPKAWADAQAVGWISKPKPGGKDFEHFCRNCSVNTNDSS